MSGPSSWKPTEKLLRAIVWLGLIETSMEASAAAVLTNAEATIVIMRIVTVTAIAGLLLSNKIAM
jgi:hypothetical protein